MNNNNLLSFIGDKNFDNTYVMPATDKCTYIIIFNLMYVVQFDVEYLQFICRVTNG